MQLYHLRAIRRRTATEDQQNTTSLLFRVLFKLDPVEKPEPTIKVYKRRNEAGEVVSWYAEIKIPGTSMWADVPGPAI